MFLEENKEEIKNKYEESENVTEKFMKKINSSLFDMLKNPTDEQIKKFRDTRDALLVGWLAAIMGPAKKDYYKSAQVGIDVADRQLKLKNKTEIVNKKINKKTYIDKVNNSINSLSADLQYIANSIKSNSEKLIKEIKSSPLVNTKAEQKKISTKLVADLKEKGITFFTDKIGRKTPIEKYIKMRVLTDTVTMQRTSYFVRAIQYGVDLVRIVHLNIHPTCELCSPFEGKILSIQGDTAGYMTLEDAQMNGLFHPNCDHVPEELELEPINKGGEGEIKLNESNQKRLEYNKKTNVI